MATDEIYIYPNPSEGNFVISLPEHHFYSDLEILNTDGKIIFTKPITSETLSIELNRYLNLAKGVYFIKLFEEDNFIVKKLVVN